MKRTSDHDTLFSSNRRGHVRTRPSCRALQCSLFFARLLVRKQGILTNEKSALDFGWCLVWTPPGHPLGLFALANQRAEVAFSTSPHPRRYLGGSHLQALIARTSRTSPCRLSPPFHPPSPSPSFLRFAPSSVPALLGHSLQGQCPTISRDLHSAFVPRTGIKGAATGMYPHDPFGNDSGELPPLSNGTHGCFLARRA